MKRISTLTEKEACELLDRADKFLKDGMTLETAWIVYRGTRMLDEMIRQLKPLKSYRYRSAEAIIKLQRRMGAIIALMDANDPSAVHFGPATPKSLMMHKSDISHWKQLANIPDELLADCFEVIEQSKDRLTTTEVLNEAAALCHPAGELFEPSAIFGGSPRKEEVGDVTRWIDTRPKPESIKRAEFNAEDEFRARGMGIRLD